MPQLFEGQRRRRSERFAFYGENRTAEQKVRDSQLSAQQYAWRRQMATVSESGSASPYAAQKM